MANSRATVLAARVTELMFMYIEHGGEWSKRKKEDIDGRRDDECSISGAKSLLYSTTSDQALLTRMYVVALYLHGENIAVHAWIYEYKTCTGIRVHEMRLYIFRLFKMIIIFIKLQRN